MNKVAERLFNYVTKINENRWHFSREIKILWNLKKSQSPTFRCLEWHSKWGSSRGSPGWTQTSRWGTGLCPCCVPRTSFGFVCSVWQRKHSRDRKNMMSYRDVGRLTAVLSNPSRDFVQATKWLALRSSLERGLAIRDGWLWRSSNKSCKWEWRWEPWGESWEPSYLAGPSSDASRLAPWDKQ